MRRLEKNGTNRVTRDSRAMEFDLNKSLRRSADSLSLSPAAARFSLSEQYMYVVFFLVQLLLETFFSFSFNF